MSIVRGPRPDKNFTVLRNAVALDERLSYRARGILTAVLARPDDWRIDSTQLARQAREGREAVRAALRELEVCGYLRRVKSTDESGKWSTDQVIYDTPQPSEDGFPGVGSPGVGKPGAHTKTGTKDGDQTTLPRQKNLGRGKITQPRTASDGTATPLGVVDLDTGEILSSSYKPCTECHSTTGSCRCFDEPEPVDLVTGAGFYRAGMRGPEPSGW